MLAFHFVSLLARLLCYKVNTPRSCMFFAFALFVAFIFAFALRSRFRSRFLARCVLLYLADFQNLLDVPMHVVVLFAL